jgi:hypothetical protein
MKLQFSGARHPVVFQAADAVAGEMKTILANWPQIDPTHHDVPIEVKGRHGDFDVASPFLDAPIEGLTSVAAACGAIVDTAQSLLEANPDYLCLHCTAYETGGQLVVLTGSAHAGKSTLAARMCAEDVLVYCDDMLPLTAPDNLGLALGIPPRPRMPLPQSAGQTIAAHIRDHTAANDGKYCYLDTHHLAEHGRTAPIGAVILLDRRKDGPAGFAPAGRSEALKHLLLRNMMRELPARTITDRLDAILEAVPCIKLFYSRLDDAAELLTKTFGHWPVSPVAIAPSDAVPGAPLLTVDTDSPSPPRGLAVPLDIPFTRAPGVLARAVDAELFLFDAQDVSVLHMNTLATGIWALLEEPITLDEAVDTLATAFPDTPRDTILADTRSLFNDLSRNRLIVQAV